MVMRLKTGLVDAEGNAKIILFEIMLFQVKRLLGRRGKAENNEQQAQEGVLQEFGFRPLYMQHIPKLSGLNEVPEKPVLFNISTKS